MLAVWKMGVEQVKTVQTTAKKCSLLYYSEPILYMKIYLHYVLYIILTGLALCDVPDDIFLGDSPRHWHRDSSQVPVQCTFAVFLKCFIFKRTVI